MVSVSFSKSVQAAFIPVKNTFIHFDTCPLPHSMVRTSSCPPLRDSFGAGIDNTGLWAGGMNELCYAMVPKTVGQMAAADVYFTPDSSPRYLSFCEQDPTALHSDNCSSVGRESLEMDSAALVYETQKPHAADEERELEQKHVQWTTVRSRRRRSKLLGPQMTRSGPAMRPLQELEAEFNDGRPDLSRRADGNTTERAANVSPAPLQDVMHATMPQQVSVRPQQQDMIQTEPQQNIVNVHPYGPHLRTQRFLVGIEGGSLPVLERLFGPGSEFTKRVIAESVGAKVWVCGQGSCTSVCEATSGCSGPLAICVSALAGPSFDTAAMLVQERLEWVQHEHKCRKDRIWNCADKVTGSVWDSEPRDRLAYSCLGRAEDYSAQEGLFAPHAASQE